MSKVGFVAVDTQGKWLGGRYYLQHIIRSVSSLPANERLPICDVWWRESSEEDPFREVRDLMNEKVVVRPPTNAVSRLIRAVKRKIGNIQGAADLFKSHDIGVVFPVSPCSNPGIPLIYWLPDFQYKHMPELFGEKLIQFYDESYGSSVEAANQVVLSSQHAFRDFERYFPQYVEKANVVHFCSVPDENWWRLDPVRVAEKHNLPDSFFVLSNQFSHHKNHMTVFKAVKRLRDNNIRVTVACTGSTYGFRGDDYFEGVKKYLNEHQLHDQVRILGMLPRDEQVALMRRAIAFLQPSAFEGWSTVVEDAKTLGKTILLSDIEVHREQMASDYPHFLPIYDETAWAKLMGAIYQSHKSGPDRDAEARGNNQMTLDQKGYGRDFMRVVLKAMS